jgi:hypothetical protein
MGKPSQWIGISGWQWGQWWTKWSTRITANEGKWRRKEMNLLILVISYYELWHGIDMNWHGKLPGKLPGNYENSKGSNKLSVSTGFHGVWPMAEANCLDSSTPVCTPGSESNQRRCHRWGPGSCNEFAVFRSVFRRNIWKIDVPTPS